MVKKYAYYLTTGYQILYCSDDIEYTNYSNNTIGAIIDVYKNYEILDLAFERDDEMDDQQESCWENTGKYLELTSYLDDGNDYVNDIMNQYQRFCSKYIEEYWSLPVIYSDELYNICDIYPENLDI